MELVSPKDSLPSVTYLLRDEVTEWRNGSEGCISVVATCLISEVTYVFSPAIALVEFVVRGVLAGLTALFALVMTGHRREQVLAGAKREFYVGLSALAAGTYRLYDLFTNLCLKRITPLSEDSNYQKVCAKLFG